MLPANPSAQRPLSVWELTSQIKDLLEAAFPEVWVAGEISNFARPQSGHCYLTLKDDRAQIRAVMWRGVAVRHAIRSARRLGSRLPRAARRLCPAGQLPVDHRETSCRGAWARWSWPCGNCARSWPAKGCSIRRASGRCRPSCGGSRWSPARPARPSAIFCRCSAGGGAGPTC